ncbi:MAG: hypothetical protein AAF234_08370 [Pseudomonadota bacterium]
MRSQIARQSTAARFANRKRLATADLLGRSSNQFDDLFKDLEDWEAILSTLPDFGVDQNPDEMELPVPDID